MKWNFINGIFTTLLLTGSFGFYLWLYGAFRPSLGGWLFTIATTLLITYLDLRWRGCTYNKNGKLAMPNLMICLIFYCAFAGFLLLRAWHEALDNTELHAGTASLFESRSYGGRLCRYKVVTRAPVDFSGRKICTSKKAYFDILRNSNRDYLTGLRRVNFEVKKSPFGSTIYLLADQ